MDDWDQAQRMLKAGSSWTATASRTGISVDRLKRRFDPGYADHRAEKVRMWRAQNGRSGHGGSSKHWHHDLPFYHVDPALIAQAIATVPADTRSRTGRLLGDPLPGRSALERSAR